MTPIELLNHVANHPDVLPHCAPHLDRADMADFFDNPRNIAVGDEAGLVLFAHGGDVPDHGPIYELHYLLTAALRGPDAYAAIAHALTVVFTATEACAIYGVTPRSNRAARAMNRALGARPVGQLTTVGGVHLIKYVLDRATWIARSRPSTQTLQ